MILGGCQWVLFAFRLDARCSLLLLSHVATPARDARDLIPRTRAQTRSDIILRAKALQGLLVKAGFERLGKGGKLRVS